MPDLTPFTGLEPSKTFSLSFCIARTQGGEEKERYLVFKKKRKNILQKLMLSKMCRKVDK